MRYRGEDVMKIRSENGEIENFQGLTRLACFGLLKSWISKETIIFVLKFVVLRKMWKLQSYGYSFLRSLFIEVVFRIYIFIYQRIWRKFYMTLLLCRIFCQNLEQKELSQNYKATIGREKFNVRLFFINTFSIRTHS